MILVIDEFELLFGTLEPMISGSSVKMVRAKDVPSAKRKLIEAEPKVILIFTKIGTDEEAGYKFCKELQSHPTLSQVPVLLFSEELTDTVLRMGSESGAKGIAPWPLSAESLMRRLTTLLPELAEVSEASKEKPAAKPSTSGSSDSLQTAKSPAKAAAAPVPPSRKNAPTQIIQAPKQLSDFDQKLQIAQQILARVLYDLKTSHLLQVVDMEDVPGVVAELTRSACNAGTPEKEKKTQTASPMNFSFAGGGASATPPASADPKPAANPTESKASEVVGIDLDKIFGLKKS